MKKRSLIVPVLVWMLGYCALPAFACKELVVFPEHLSAASLSEPSSFYVVTVLSESRDAFSVRVDRSFGGALVSGASATLQFAQGEEPHAVCPISIGVGESYLVGGRVAGSRIVISRYNWMNISAKHERFTIYVQDLQSSTKRTLPRSKP